MCVCVRARAMDGDNDNARKRTLLDVALRVAESGGLAGLATNQTVQVGTSLVGLALRGGGVMSGREEKREERKGRKNEWEGRNGK